MVGQEAVAIYVLTKGTEDLERPVAVDLSPVVFNNELVALEFDIILESVVSYHGYLSVTVKC